MQESLRILSKGDLVDLVELSRTIAQAYDATQAKTALDKIRSLLPAESVVSIRIKGRADLGVQAVTGLVNAGYDAEWLSLYEKRRYDRVDPVLSRCLADPGVQVWSRVFRQSKARAEQKFIAVCRDFGLIEGLTAGTAGPRSEATILSLRGRELAQADRHQVIVQALAPVLHNMMLRISRDPVESGGAQVGILTRREREVLSWIARGKTNWEAARIIGVKERTIAFHLGNTMRKLDAYNRAQAVARGSSLGLI